MGWFRSNRSVVTWLAFFALACQFLLAFGHVHVGMFGGGSAAWAAAENRDVSAGVAPSSPQKIPIGHSGDFCAICTDISLAGMPVVPIPTIVLAPIYSPTFCGRHLRTARGPLSTIFHLTLVALPRSTRFTSIPGPA